ncbi:MAG TPA: HmuY family protein, partial [Polyangiaceae bacterium]|nr:HmuY family protein [Polyangiaceae bacterium]
MKRRLLVGLLVEVALGLASGCSSTPIDDQGGGSGSGSSSAGSSNGGDTPRACGAALKQALSLVDEVSTATVSVLSDGSGERTLYVDATAGGLDAKDEHPWVYLSLSSGEAVALTDPQALQSKAWDLAFKRNLIRTNSGDSGPGQGGAIRIALPWDTVERTTLGNKSLPIEEWFDADCMLQLSDTGDIITTFGNWDEYDEANHVLTPADV